MPAGFETDAGTAAVGELFIVILVYAGFVSVKWRIGAKFQEL